MRTYGKPGSKKSSFFKKGYLDGLKGGCQPSSPKGRNRVDYERGYCCGIYWATLYTLYRGGD